MKKHFHMVKQFSVLPFTPFSDHSPITFTLCCNSTPIQSSAKQTEYLKWDDDYKTDLRRRVISRLPELNHVSNNCTTSRDEEIVNKSLNDFVNVLREASDPLCLKRYTDNGTPRYTNTNARPAEWFDNECAVLKQAYLRAYVRSIKTEQTRNRVLFCDNKSNYKRMVTKKRRAYLRQKRNNIIQQQAF